MDMHFLVNFVVTNSGIARGARGAIAPLFSRTTSQKPSLLMCGSPGR